MLLLLMMMMIIIIIIIIIECACIAQHHPRFLCASHPFSPGMGSARSSISSTSCAAYSPAAITALETIQTHKLVVLVQAGTHFSPGLRECKYTGELICPRTQRHTAAAETRTRYFSIQSRGP